MSDFERSDELIILLGQLDRIGNYYLNHSFEKSGFPVTREQWVIMKMLWEKNGVSQQELADDLMKNKASITSLIENMEKKDLVSRKTNSFDKRSKMVFLTEKGKDIRLSIDDFFRKLTQDFVKSIDVGELNTTRNVLEKMLANLVHMKKKNLLKVVAEKS